MAGDGPVSLLVGKTWLVVWFNAVDTANRTLHLNRFRNVILNDLKLQEFRCDAVPQTSKQLVPSFSPNARGSLHRAHECRSLLSVLWGCG
jgi:hypothetical protein